MGTREIFLGIVIALSMVFLLTCDKSLEGKTSSAEKQSVNEITQYKFSFRDTPGVVRLSRRTQVSQDKIRFFNADGSIWFVFPVTTEQVENEAFKPFSMKLDYALLILTCVRDDSAQFEVIVNKETGLKKIIKKSDQTFELQSWDNFILELFAIDFDKKLNPLRSNPSATEPVIKPPQGVFFHPVQIKGDWVQVRIEDTSGSKPQVRGYGWVKWKEEDKFLIDFFYFA